MYGAAHRKCNEKQINKNTKQINIYMNIYIFNIGKYNLYSLPTTISNTKNIPKHLSQNILQDELPQHHANQIYIMNTYS